MNFDDCVARAAWRALESDVPEELMPLTISNQAALWAGMDASESMPRCSMPTERWH